MYFLNLHNKQRLQQVENTIAELKQIDEDLRMEQLEMSFRFLLLQRTSNKGRSMQETPINRVPGTCIQDNRYFFYYYSFKFDPIVCTLYSLMYHQYQYQYPGTPTMLHTLPGRKF
jgi:hypothetical protein